jgi:hypothetical protein
MDIPVRAMILLLLLFGAACMAPRLCRATPPSMDANICPCTHTEGNMDVDQMQAHTVTQTVTAKDKAARHTIAIVGVPGHGH